MEKTQWTHEELQAAADGDYARFAALSRRRILKGGLAAAGVMAMPILPRQAQAGMAGDLITMTWEGFDNVENTKDWAAKNGIKETNSSMATQDDVQTKLVGGSPVRLDVTSYNQAYNTFYADELKILKPLDLAQIPNYNEADIFQAFYKKDRWFWNNTQWGIPFCWGLVTLLYNPQKMAKPESYTDLLKPEYQGKFVISDDNTGTWPTFAKVAGVDTYPNVTKSDLTKIFDTAKKYRDNAKGFAASNGDIVSQVISGDIWACLCCGTDSVSSIKRQGGSADYVIPKEGAFMWSDALCIPVSTGNPEGAIAFINEAMSAKAQAATCAHTICGSPSRRAVEVMDADTKAIFDYANLDEVLKNIPLLGIPPRESTDIATYDEWVKAYESLKSGI